MIFQSPESDMPEPYKTYVRERNDSIAEVLADVVQGADVQLCPRAVLEEEVEVDESGIVYGAVVSKLAEGYKSLLYEGGLQDLSKVGVSTGDYNEAEEFALKELEAGNRVRVKDPKESDGNGQYVIENIGELGAVFGEIAADTGGEVVLMPNLEEISHRVSVGHINLGRYGVFGYLGNEQSLARGGSEVYGGTEMGLFTAGHTENMRLVEESLDIPHALSELGSKTIEEYERIAIRLGRVSVDLVQGVTGSGETVQAAIDITPRVGGVTPAEVLALRDVSRSPDSVCFARSRLLYGPDEKPTTGSNFLDSEDLIINAEIVELVA
jgi:hypothetical protein